MRFQDYALESVFSVQQNFVLDNFDPSYSGLCQACNWSICIAIAVIYSVQQTVQRSFTVIEYSVENIANEIHFFSCRPLYLCPSNSFCSQNELHVQRKRNVPKRQFQAASPAQTRQFNQSKMKRIRARAVAASSPSNESFIYLSKCPKIQLLAHD